MRSLPPLSGNLELRARLSTAARRGTLSASLLLRGPVGVGKQRLALWLAQLLVCEDRRAAEPCDTCKACRLALRLEHPDIHWFFPLPRPRSGSASRLAEALEEARANELEARRVEPYRVTEATDGPTGLYLAQVLTIRRLATARPAMAGHRVFIIGDAEFLIPQEASQEAANALLKVLEEPPADSTFILTAAEPGALLPTLRSRLQSVRVRPWSAGELADLLVAEFAVDRQKAGVVAHIAGGCIGQAIGLLAKKNETGSLEELRARARDLLAAAARPDPAVRLAAALALGTTGARGSFADCLQLLAIWIRDLAAVANGEKHALINIDAVDFLEDLAGSLPGAGNAAGVPLVDEALALTRNNVNPQLILAWLLRRVHEAVNSPDPVVGPAAID